MTGTLTISSSPVDALFGAAIATRFADGRLYIAADQDGIHLHPAAIDAAVNNRARSHLYVRGYDRTDLCDCQP
jgi:hypothetical protein